MAHLVEPIKNEAIDATIDKLIAAHKFLQKRLRAAHTRQLCAGRSNSGISAKRIKVRLTGKHKPNIIGKSEENYVETINMIATLERLIAALQFIRRRYSDKTMSVRHCHPSTSSDEKSDSNDLIIIDRHHKVKIRCEVSDVISINPSQNNKEKKDLKSLGCEHYVPNDGVDRYLCVSPEFAGGLTNKKRAWKRYQYKYEALKTGDATGTIMLKILDKSSAT